MREINGTVVYTNTGGVVSVKLRLDIANQAVYACLSDHDKHRLKKKLKSMEMQGQVAVMANAALTTWTESLNLKLDLHCVKVEDELEVQIELIHI